MGFLAPAFLGLAALAGVPVLIHFLRRRIGRTVEFPAVRYLLRMEREHSRELKLKNRLLLILRILAVITLALAAARPIARIFGGVGHAPVAVALVIDNSMSSGVVINGRPRIDAFRDEALALLGKLGAADRAWLVTADGHVVGGTTDAVRQAVQAIHPLGGRGDLAAAVRRSVALARSGAPRAGIVALLSDGQQNAFAAANDSIVIAEEIPVIAFVPPMGVIRNRSVLSAQPEPARWTPGGTVRMRFASSDSAPWRILLDGRNVARGTARGGSVARPVEVDSRVSTTSGGWVRGSVEVDADELRADDVRYFAVRVAPPPTVLVRPEIGPFASAALAILSDEGRLARTATPNASTIVVAGADADQIRTPVLLAAPLDPVRIGEANRSLARLGIPWRFGAIAHNGVTARIRERTGDSTAAAGSTPSTPARNANPLDGARVLLRYPLQSSPGANTTSETRVDTLATAGGAPWVVSGPGYLIIGSPLDPEATDLPLRAGFVPWLQEVLTRRLGDDGLHVDAVPGERLEKLFGTTGLERADGTVLPITADDARAPNEPGVYFLRRGDARIGALVVNPEPEESAFDSTSATSFIAAVRGRTVKALDSGDAWRRAVISEAEGRALLPILVGLALVWLVLEAWFARLSASQSIETARSESTRRAA